MFLLIDVQSTPSLGLASLLLVFAVWGSLSVLEWLCSIFIILSCCVFSISVILCDFLIFFIPVWEEEFFVKFMLFFCQGKITSLLIPTPLIIFCFVAVEVYHWWFDNIMIVNEIDDGWWITGADFIVFEFCVV